MADPSDDTLAADHDTARDDTLMASSDADASARPSASRIRSSTRAPAPARTDYETLVEVDPAHYVIEREIARGGMGRILIARDRRLGREVAVKEVLSRSARVARRFEREARISARLQHPSIVSVHEAGVWPSGEPFYAMRLVTGRSLDQAIAAAPTYAARLALVPSVLAVADAMAYAHERAVIHRDLKPRNVVVGEFGETVVIDWGLAKELGHDEPSDAGDSGERSEGGDSSVGGSTGSETIAGEVLGTPAYMPPEQANGEAVDARADVYAIGALLYHVLAGVAPYAGESNAEVLAAVFAGPPTAIRARVAEIPLELAAIVERAMARTPADRYATARDLAEDLRRFQTGRMVGAHRYSLRQLVRRWARRNRTVLIAAGAAVALALVVGVIALRRVVAAERTAQLERGRAIEQRQAAEALLDFMLGDMSEKLAAVGKLEVLEDVARRALAYYDAHTVARGPADLRGAAAAHLALGKVMVARGDLPNAIAEFERSQGQASAAMSADPDDLLAFRRYVTATIAWTDARGSQGDRGAADARILGLIPEVEAWLERMPEEPALWRNLATLRGRVAASREEQGELTEALEQFQLALAHAEKVGELDPGPKADKVTLVALAGVARMRAAVHRDLDGALEMYRRGLEIGERNLARDPEDPHWLDDAAISYNEIGGLLMAQRKLPEAARAFEQGRALAERAVAVDRSNTHTRSSLATVLERLGMVAIADGRPDDATGHFVASLEIWSEMAAADPSNDEWQQARTLLFNKLGDVRMKVGDPRGALVPYGEALAIRVALVARDPDHARRRRDLFYSHYKIAMAQRAAGDRAATRAAFTAAIEVASVTRAAHPDNDTYAEDEAESRGELGNELVAVGDVAGARTQYEAALVIARAKAAGANADPDWATLVTGLEAGLAKLPAR